MSSENPESAIDAMVGKTYEFRGKTISMRMIALIALEKCGVPLATVGQNPTTATVVAIFSLVMPPQKVWRALRANSLFEQAEAYAQTLTPAELRQAEEIVADMLLRYVESAATYASGDKSSEGNDQAVAAKS